jgi:glycosyltransferase involved in cell wall biosynthesis
MLCLYAVIYLLVLSVRRDIHDLLRCCDLFVFPSLYEGLGISLIEAMLGLRVRGVAGRAD